MMTQQSLQMSRRQFIAAGAAAVASPFVFSSNVLGRGGVIPPSERIVIANIGCGNMGGGTIGALLGDRRNFQLVAVCDAANNRTNGSVDRVNREYGNNDCRGYARYEDILDRDDIDAVAVVTPDHWHTKISIEACIAGKDVFCEKPLTLTPVESRHIVAAARKYNRVCTNGSQRVMEDYGYMAPIIQSGAIGEVKEAFFEVGPPPTDPYYPEEAIPSDWGLDWDRWLGPAPLVPYNYQRFSGNFGGGWRRYRDYGNGFLADWGTHKLAGILYVMGIDHLEPLEILPPGCEGNPHNDRLTFIFEGGIRIHHVRGGHDVTFVGSEGEFRHNVHRNVIIPRHHVDVRRYHGGATNIYGDFAYCVRHRLRPFQDFFYGAVAATCCQLAVIGYRMNRPLKWDAETTSFIGDDIANRFVSRPRRGGYEIRGWNG